ncbi:MAG: flagellar biosynthesis protein FlhB [Thalassovita sp.]
MEDENTEKPHEPTQRKLDEARKKGEVAKSSDLATASSFLGLLMAISLLGASSVSQLGTVLASFLAQSDSLAKDLFSGGASAIGGTLGGATLKSFGPWLLLPMCLALTSHIITRSFLITPSKLQPKLSRISLLSNAKNKFGRSGLFEFAKSFAKLVIFSVCLGFYLRAHLPTFAELVWTEPAIIALAIGKALRDFLAIVFLVALGIGGIDFLWQTHEHLRKNQMSQKDLKDEQKDTEGDPHLKQKRRQRAVEISSKQMMTAVPDADVVIVNPTHFAVALSWNRHNGEVPTCVAKGVDEVAARIRRIAMENAVPVHSDPPTARALFANTDIGAEISQEHYRAVAAAIRFADAIRHKAKTS